MNKLQEKMCDVFVGIVTYRVLEKLYIYKTTLNTDHYVRGKICSTLKLRNGEYFLVLK